MQPATNTSKKTRKPRGPNKPKVVGRNDDALFIVKKYVKPSSVEWRRDMVFAYKLLEKFPERSFWDSLECKFQIDSMVILWSVESRNKLKFAYERFKTALDMQKKIAIAPKIVYHLQNEKVGEDYIVPKRKPRTVLEFLKHG